MQYNITPSKPPEQLKVSALYRTFVQLLTFNKLCFNPWTSLDSYKTKPSYTTHNRIQPHFIPSVMFHWVVG